MRPLRHLPTLTTIALLALGVAGSVQAQGFSMGEAVDDSGAPLPDAQAPQIGAPQASTPQTPQAMSPDMGQAASPGTGLPEMGAALDPAMGQTDPHSLGAPVDAAMPSVMGEPAEPNMGVDAQTIPDGGMGEPVANSGGTDFGVPMGGIAAVPEAAPIPTTTITGIVKSYNESTLNLIMANRTVYRLPADFVDPGLKNGTKVKIQWYADGSARRATEVSIVKQ